MADLFADELLNLGNALLQRGKADEAILQFQAILQLNPEDGEAQNNLAKAQALAKQEVTPR